MLRLLPGLLLAACVSVPAVAADQVTTSEADAGKTIPIRMGQSLVVNLSGPHGAGNYWRLDSDLTPELVLSGRTTKLVDVAGAPETTSFSFTTSATGSVTFKASYLKPGAPIPKASDVAFTIKVEP